MWKSRVLYLLTLFAAAWLASAFDDKHLAFTALYGVALLPVLSLLSVVLCPLAIRISETASVETAFKGEKLVYTLGIRNRLPILYPSAKYRFHSGELLGYGERLSSGVLTPGSSMSRSFEIPLDYRGVYRLGLASMEVTDFLGLFRTTVQVGGGLSVTVYPLCDDGFDVIIRQEPKNSSYLTDLVNEDYSSIADVRKYTSSDSLRRVHWQLSARRGELVVKNFSALVPDNTILLLDNRPLPLEGRTRLCYEDKMVSYAASAASFFSERRQYADIVFGDPDKDFISIADNDDILRVFSMLAQVDFDSGESALSHAPKISGAYNMIIFCAVLDDSVHDTIKNLISHDHSILVIFFHGASLPMNEHSRFYLESLEACGAKVTKVPVLDGDV